MHTHQIAPMGSPMTKKWEGSLYGVLRRRFIPATHNRVQRQRQEIAQGPGLNMGEWGAEQSIGANGLRAQGQYKGGAKDSSQ